MGGDRGPSEVISGVVAASKELKNAFFILVGDEKEITGPALFGGLDVSRFSVVGTSDVVLMEDDPLTVIRHKPDSSMVKGLNMLASGEGDTIVSTGNTGALVTGGRVFEDGSLILGSPAKTVRTLSPEEIRGNRISAAHYVQQAIDYSNSRQKE